MSDFPLIDNPFFRESLRPLQATTQHIRDKRFKPTVEAVYLKRSEHPELIVNNLPKEGKITVPIIEGKPGDPNRHQLRERKIEKEVDEYLEFRSFSTQYEELLNKISAIRKKSEIYPIWAKDKPQMPTDISRRFSELNQQLFSLRKCFVSPEEIMLDNAASLIQRVWRSKLRKQYFQKAIESIKSFKKRELYQSYKTLNSWLAQMEYADSRAQQFRFRGLSRICKFSSRFWQKWSEREGINTKRLKTKGIELNNKFTERRFHQSFKEWFKLATGGRSRKAMKSWRLSMVPKMKQELERYGRESPQSYLALVSTFIELRTQHNFVFNFFIAWHSRVRSKSLRETVGNRNAFLLYKKRILKWSFQSWIKGVRKTKEFLGTKEKWKRYIALNRSIHQSKMENIRILVKNWHQYSHTLSILRKKEQRNKKKVLKIIFKQWRITIQRQLQLKLHSIQMWKRFIQDPKISIFRAWKIYAIKKRTRRQVTHELMKSHTEWHSRFLIEYSFGKWQSKFSYNKLYRSSIALEKRKWDLQRTKKNTANLSTEYSKEREIILGIEEELGLVTKEYIQKEDEISSLEEISTTWRIALHAMKMEFLRLALTVQKCYTPHYYKKRRYSDEDRRDRLKNDDRYGEETNSRLNSLKISERVIEKWERRNSDPELDLLPLVNINPPLDENIVQLISSDLT